MQNGTTESIFIRVSCRTIGFSSHTVNPVERGSTAQPVYRIHRDYEHMHKRVVCADLGQFDLLLFHKSSTFDIRFGRGNNLFCVHKCSSRYFESKLIL